MDLQWKLISKLFSYLAAHFELCPSSVIRIAFCPFSRCQYFHIFFSVDDDGGGGSVCGVGDSGDGGDGDGGDAVITMKRIKQG